MLLSFIPVFSAAMLPASPAPFYFIQEPVHFTGLSKSPLQIVDFMGRPPTSSTPDIITGEQVAGPLHEDWANFAFDLEVTPPQDDEEYTYKRDDNAGLPRFWTGYGFVPVYPGPSMPVSTEDPDSTISINISSGTADWSGAPLLSNRSKITPSIEKFLSFAFGPGTEYIIAEEPDDGVNLEEEIDSECTSFHCQLSRLFPGHFV